MKLYVDEKEGLGYLYTCRFCKTRNITAFTFITEKEKIQMTITICDECAEALAIALTKQTQQRKQIACENTHQENT